MVSIAGGKYKVVKRIGGGAFGEVFIVQVTRATSHAAEGDLLAAKFEPVKSSHQPHLFHEARVYATLSREVITVGIPKCRWYGVEGDYNVLVMDLVGPSLSELMDYCHGKFSLKSVLMIADQLISRLEFVHTSGYLHRDLKPDNFAMGRGKLAHHLYMLDFGLAKRYMDPKSGKHIPYRDGKSLTGTARYVSLNTHLGIQQSRRDDIEGAAFVLIYLAKGFLPWQNVKSTTKLEKYERIKAMKISTTPQALCSKLPNCFADLLIYSRKLDFEASPNYDVCRRMFSEEMEAQGFPLDYRFCWLPGPESTSSHAGLSRTNSWADNGSNLGEGGSTVMSGRSSRRTESGSGFGSPHGSGIFRRAGMRRSSSAVIADDDLAWGNHPHSPGRAPDRRHHDDAAHPLDDYAAK